MKTGVESDSPEGYNFQANIPTQFEERENILSNINVAIANVREEEEAVTYNQKGVYAMGRSSYSSDKIPNFQLTMLQGQISGSTHFLREDGLTEGSILDSYQIPQIDIDLIVSARAGNIIDDEIDDSRFISQVFEDGTFVELSFTEPIIHMKEFNSFYEKENFDIEVFQITTRPLRNNTGESIKVLTPLKFYKPISAIHNDILIDDTQGDQPSSTPNFFAEEGLAKNFVEYFFSIDVDNEIPVEELCQAVDKLEVNSQFLDEELICPDQRTERFSIYSTRVDPTDLEDCD